MVDTCCKLEDSVDICASFSDSDAETCCGHVLYFVEAEFAKKSVVWVESRFLNAVHFYIVVLFILLGFRVMKLSE